MVALTIMVLVVSKFTAYERECVLTLERIVEDQLLEACNPYVQTAYVKCFLPFNSLALVKLLHILAFYW